MRFIFAFKLTSYLLVLSAILALCLSPAIESWLTLLVFVSIGLSWFFEPPRFHPERFTAVWNLLTILCLGYAGFEIWTGESVLVAGAHFLLFVLVNKLFNRTSGNDYKQLYTITFLLLVVASTLNVDLSYAVCFAFYTIFVTWALTLLYLHRELEASELIQHETNESTHSLNRHRVLNSKRLITPSFFGGTSLVSMGVLLFAGTLFIFFPRLGFGFFVSPKRHGVALSGFSDKVELGYHGVIKDNPQVVMRVLFPKGRPTALLRWRGAVYDRYEQGVWSQSDRFSGKTQSLEMKDRLYLINRAPGLADDLPPAFIRETFLKQEIYLEPINSTVLFAADRPIAIELMNQGLRGMRARQLFVPRRGPLGEIHAHEMRTAGVYYAAYSHRVSVPQEMLQKAQMTRNPDLDHFLDLPPGYPARVGALAHHITREAKTLYDKVEAIQTHLKQHYQYTLSLRHEEGAEPIDEFLFVTRKGHCEYFASAMIVLLRHLGIHARNINGFAAGEWNPYGNYLAIRQGDAHAWVEVLFPNVGWMTYDPTPSAPSRTASAQQPVERTLRQVFDTIRMRWFRYVVEYDLRQQISLLSQVRNWVRQDSPHTKKQIGHVPLNHEQRTRLKRIVVFVILICVGGFLVWRAFRPKSQVETRRSGSPKHRPITQSYKKMLKILTQSGHAKPNSETPQEFTQRLEQTGFKPFSIVDVLTKRYYAIRYGDIRWTQAEERRFAALMRRLQKRIRELSKQTPNKDIPS